MTSKNRENEFLETITTVRQNVDEQLKSLYRFHVSFIDGKDFRKFIQELINDEKREFVSYHYMSRSKMLDRICVMGYFSEGICDLFSDYAKKGSTVRLISRREKMDRNTQIVLGKMREAGVQIKTNDKSHARMFLAYKDSDHSSHDNTLILGSFDFNKEGLTADRRDAGVKTSNPVLVNSAIEFFEEIWNDKFETKDFQLLEK